LSWSRARRTPEPKASPSSPRRPRPSLPVIALDSFTPGPPFPVHSSVRDERKQRRELLLRKAPQAGRHTKFSIVIDGTQVKFELDTRLTVSCVVAVVSAYGLVTVSIAFDSILLAFGNAVILLLILFVLFGWRELLGEFSKKRSAAK